MQDSSGLAPRSASQAEGVPVFPVTPEAAVEQLVNADPRCLLFATVRTMERVETWVLERSKGQPGIRLDEAILERLTQLGRIIEDRGDRVQPDHPAVVEILASLHTSMHLLVVQYLGMQNPMFLKGLVDYCLQQRENSVHALLVLDRWVVLKRTHVLERIMSAENVAYVQRVIGQLN